MAKKRPAGRTKRASRALTQQDHDFVRQILDRPEADEPRLAYADWLQQQGDRARAEFIRCQIEAARLDPQDPQREKLVARADTLLKAHAAEWGALLSPGASARVGSFARGFPTWARCELEAFPTVAATLWQVAPVTHLELYDYNAATSDVDFKESWISVEAYQAMASVPQLIHVRSLSVAECAIRGKHLEPLLDSPHLTGLRELRGSSNRLGDTGARVVAESPVAARLTVLDLSEDGIGNRGAEALAQSQHLANLKTLLLRVNRIGEEGGRAIAGSPFLSHLEQLDLGGNRLGEAEEPLRRRFGHRLTL
jgi:uncharacterized protein (TIGR02996 family)